MPGEKLNRILRIVLILSCGIVLFSCRNSLGIWNDGSAQVNIIMEVPEPRGVQGRELSEEIVEIWIRITAAEMPSIVRQIDPAEGSASFRVPSGDKRTFELTVRGIAHVYRGIVEIDLEPGIEIDLPILLEETETLVTGISLDQQRIFLLSPNTRQLTAAVSPADATNPDLSFSSSDPSVALVNADGLVTAITPGESTISVVSHDGGISAECEVKVGTPGSLRWKLTEAETGISFRGGRPAVGLDGTLYVPGIDTAEDRPVMAAIDPQGFIRWTYTNGTGANNFYTFSSAAIGTDETGSLEETIYFAGSVYSPDLLYAMNPDGTLKWAYDDDALAFANSTTYSPSIAADGTVYVVGGVGSEGGQKVYAVNPDGTGKWVFTQSSAPGVSDPIRIHSKLAVGSSGRIFFGTNYDSMTPARGHFFGVNPDGSPAWVRTDDGMGNDALADRPGTSPAVGSDGTVYLGTYNIDTSGDTDGPMIALDPADGTDQSYIVPPSGTGMDFYAPSIGNNDILYAASTHGYIVSVAHPGTWSKKWEYAVGSDIIFTTPSIGADGTLYVRGGTDKRVLYALTPGTSAATVKWTYDTGAENLLSVTVDTDGALYFTSQDGTLWAVSDNSGGLADTPWPMLGHDVRHTGRAR